MDTMKIDFILDEITKKLQTLVSLASFKLNINIFSLLRIFLCLLSFDRLLSYLARSLQSRSCCRIRGSLNGL